MHALINYFASAVMFHCHKEWLGKLCLKFVADRVERFRASFPGLCYIGGPHLVLYN